MKKTLKLLAAVTLIALTAAACQKEQLSDSSAEGTESVTFTVQTDAATTKATADGDGSGTGLDRCLVAVYMKTGDSTEPYKLYDTPSTTKQDNEHYSFTVNLIRKQIYQIVVWADKGETVYDVNDGLTLVKRKTNDFACNSDAYDAFYASTEFVQGTTASTAITATRPFAQLNLITKDLNADFQPTAVSVTYASPQSFNPFTGEVSSDMTEVTYKADAPYYTSTDGTQHTLVMNYLFAAADEQTVLPSVKMTAKLTVDAEIEVANVPVKRNYRTNIIGNLLTEKTDFNITVNPIWGIPDIEVNVADNITAANAAFAAGNTVVEVAEITSSDPDVIILPDTDQPVTLTLPAAPADKTITIQYPDSPTQTPATLEVNANSLTNLVIDAPSTHVELNGISATNVTASTSETTLVVGADANIENLTVNQGAVEIYGTVKKINANGCPIKVWAVGDASAFNMALEKGAETIELKNDIAFSTPIKVTRSITISGNGHNVYNTANRVMSFQDTNGAILSLINLGLISNCTASSDVRGLSIWKNNSSEIVLDNCTVSASFYAINFSSDNDNLSITIKNGTVAAGWAAINSYANNSTFTIENSTLKGLNDKGESDWNDFATIVFDGYGLSIAENIGKLGTGNKLNVVNSTIYASSESSNKQAWLALQYGAQSNIVKVDAATRIIDEADNDQTYNVTLIPLTGKTTKYDLESEIWIAGQNAYPGFYQQDGVYHISTENGMQYFEKKVNDDRNSFAGKTVVLDADLDLAGIDFVSIGQTGATQFLGTFDGQSHTISNLSIVNNDESAHCATGLFGWLNSATVKNITISGATISGHHNVGTIAGYLETSGCTIEGCTVENATITCTSVNSEANGDKCGGIVGHAGNAGVLVKDCVVRNSSISAGRDAGQVVGAAPTVNVVNCSAENVTVTANGSSTGANIRVEVIGRVL